jgi:NAD kinase
MKLGIAAKYSKLEWDMYRLGISREEAIEIYKSENMNVERILDSDIRQRNSIDAITRKVSNSEIVDIISITEGQIKKPNPDMLISIGGDNFFQLCSHHFPDAYLIGVNSDPQTSHGALLNFTHESLELNIDKILNNDFRTEYWTRIAATLNGTKIEDTTCTFSLSIKATDMVTRYLLQHKGEQEEQKATGILLVTGAGSGDRAWYRNAGLYLPMIKSGLYPEVTQEFSKTARMLKTLTREPMGGADCQYLWLNKTIREDEELKLIYWANDVSELSIDSIKRYDVKQGDVLTFKVSNKPLKIVSPDF